MPTPSRLPPSLLRLWRSGAWLCAAAAWLLTVLAPAWAADDAHQRMLQSARQWVAQSQQLAPGQVQFAALDSRLQVEPCGQPLQFDYPFNQSRETVRVRCAAPKAWQLFLRLNPPTAPSAAAGAAAPRPAQAGAAALPVTLTVPTRQVVVSRRMIPRGTVLEPGMLDVIERPAQGLDPLVVGSLKDVEMAEAQRDIPMGTVLRSYDIKRTLMVRKGQMAVLTVGQDSGFQVTVSVEAQQDGHLGEQIRLKNTESGRLLSGVVTGPNAVRALKNP